MYIFLFIYNMNEPIINEDFSLSSMMDYIKENIIGILLLILTGIIIIIVDYLNRINYPSMQPPIFASTILPGMQMIQFNKPRKLRKYK